MDYTAQHGTLMRVLRHALRVDYPTPVAEVDAATQAHCKPMRNTAFTQEELAVALEPKWLRSKRNRQNRRTVAYEIRNLGCADGFI